MKPQGTAGGRSAGAAQTSEGTPRDPDALLERVPTDGNLAAALRRLEQNKGAPGVDGVHVEDLLKHLEAEGPSIRERLLAGTYRPKPVRRVEIPNPGEAQASGHPDRRGPSAATGTPSRAPADLRADV